MRRGPSRPGGGELRLRLPDRDCHRAGRQRGGGRGQGQGDRGGAQRPGAGGPDRGSQCGGGLAGFSARRTLCGCAPASGLDPEPGRSAAGFRRLGRAGRGRQPAGAAAGDRAHDRRDPVPSGAARRRRRPRHGRGADRIGQERPAVLPGPAVVPLSAGPGRILRQGPVGAGRDARGRRAMAGAGAGSPGLAPAAGRDRPGGRAGLGVGMDRRDRAPGRAGAGSEGAGGDLAGLVGPVRGAGVAADADGVLRPGPGQGGRRRPGAADPEGAPRRAARRGGGNPEADPVRHL